MKRIATPDIDTAKQEGGHDMITIDWGLFILMLAGTASLSASISLLLACLLLSQKKASPQDKSGLCGHCNSHNSDVCRTEEMYMGYEKRRKR